MSGLMFHKDGLRLNHIYRAIQEVCKERHIKKFALHGLRHCAAADPDDAGVDVETIMKIVDHSSVKMSLRYRTIKAEKLEAAMTS